MLISLLTHSMASGLVLDAILSLACVVSAYRPLSVVDQARGIDDFALAKAAPKAVDGE